MQKCLSILDMNEINELFNNSDVISNKEKLSTQNIVKFSISLSNEIKNKIENSLSIHLSDTVPMRWIKGDTLPHIDKGESNFENTYLIYLTNSSGTLIIDESHYPIVAGNAHVFSEGIEHSTINTENNERLMIGPMSENGFKVGIAGSIYYFLNKTDAETFSNIIFTNNSITIENIDSNINITLSNVSSWFMLNSNDLITQSGPYVTGHTFDPNINYYLYPASLISNICFPKDTPIVTDQGIVNIQDIKNHTIRGLKVTHITQTTSIHKELVCFEKDSISVDYPSQKTIMTRNHKLFNGMDRIVTADSLLSNNIYLIPYTGEILYNVLLEKNSFIIVNGLICETLDVNNIIALYYKSNYTIKEKNDIMTILNMNIHNKEYKDLCYKYFSKCIV